MLERAENSDRGWSHFQHGADIGIKGLGPTLAVAFDRRRWRSSLR
jgi:hypothetical protein